MHARTALQGLRVEREGRGLLRLGHDGGHALEDDRRQAPQVVEDLQRRAQLGLCVCV